MGSHILFDQLSLALTPTATSQLIDAGTFMAGIHCATVDDDSINPMPLSDRSC